MTWVYPRPRGGTAAAPAAAKRFRGLSPPTRGNPCIEIASPYDRRSIPAHAGEPDGQAGANDSGAVYPRPRGGTPADQTAIRRQAGLSPPTRGNRGFVRAVRAADGSIPAHSGEPC